MFILKKVKYLAKELMPQGKLYRQPASIAHFNLLKRCDSAIQHSVSTASVLDWLDSLLVGLLNGCVRLGNCRAPDKLAFLTCEMEL